MPPCMMHGHGPNHIIAIHGWFNDSAAFDAMLAGFDPERFTIALPDLRGYGLRRGVGGPYNMGTMAEDVLMIADALDWQRFSVIGHSMGGKAALKVALSAPARVERLVGITPVWAGEAPFDEGTRAFFRSAANDLGVRQAILDTTTGERLPTTWLKACAERSVAVSDKEAYAAYFESWSGDDFGEAASTIECPVLVIGGAHDWGIPEDMLRATWLSQLRKARLVVMPEAGHYPMDECPLALARQIIAFLEPELAR